MTAPAVLLCLAGYAAGYFLYSRFLARKLFSIDPAVPTPAHVLCDEIDYVPTRRLVLFGHHFASITGLAPMLGPAVAVIWGWLPAMIWVVAGAILVGCVHDFSSLVVSMRGRGMSIGKVAEGIIGPRAKTLFHLIIFFGIALAMGVFVYIIAAMFSITDRWDPLDPMADPSSFPTAVLPSGALVVLALVMGHLLYRRRFPLGRTTAVGFVLMLAAVWAGMKVPLLGLDRQAWPGQVSWTVMLLAYALVASILPVWSLLQARDFLNSLLLYLGLALAYLGLFVWHPDFAAPAFRPHPAGAPPIFPFVFIIVACGAASGFHSLVCSGTTAKQIDSEADARFIGYGGMIGESLLGLLAVMACTAGLAGAGTADPAMLWHSTYADWGSMQTLAAKVGTFIAGTAHFIEALGVEPRLATAFVAVVVVSFALTTLDSATRLLRFNISEIGETLRLRWLGDRYVASGLAVAAIAFFALYKLGDGQPAGLALWRLFGTTNQLLAGLALLTVTMYLKQRGRNPWYTGIPTLFMLASTLMAMISNLRTFLAQWGAGGGPLFAVGLALLVLAVWLAVEAVITLMRDRGRPPVETMQVGADS